MLNFSTHWLESATRIIVWCTCQCIVATRAWCCVQKWGAHLSTTWCQVGCWVEVHVDATLLHSLVVGCCCWLMIINVSHARVWINRWHVGPMTDTGPIVTQRSTIGGISCVPTVALVGVGGTQARGCRRLDRQLARCWTQCGGADVFDHNPHRLLLISAETLFAWVQRRWGWSAVIINWARIRWCSARGVQAATSLHGVTVVQRSYCSIPIGH